MYDSDSGRENRSQSDSDYIETLSQAQYGEAQLEVGQTFCNDTQGTFCANEQLCCIKARG